MAKNKIKKPKSSPDKITAPVNGGFTIDYPIFCFKHLQSRPKKDFKFFSDFILRLKALSTLSWNEIGTSHRHSFGTEKIPVGKIKCQLPSFITPDVTHLVVFRANGDNRPFLGIRINSLFHIIFIEEDFGDVYDHE